MHIKLADVLKLECEKPCVDIIHATVIDKSSVTTYNINKQMATVILADGTDYVKALVYDLDALTMMAVNKGIQIQDFIPKPNRQIVINKITKIFLSKPVDVSEEVRQTIKESMSKSYDTISAALSPKKTHVGQMTRIIAKASPVEKKRIRATGEEVPFKKLKLRDLKGDIEVCLWRDLAQTVVEKGDCITVRNFMVTDTFDYKNKPVPAITNKNASATIQIIPEDQELKPLLDNEQDLLEDDPAEQEPVIITGIGKILKYKSCAVPSCYRKKLNNNRCEKCGMRYTEGSASSSITGQILPENSVPLTFFTQQAEQLKDQLDINCAVTSDEFVHEILEKIPFKAIIKTKDTKVTKFKIIN